MRARLRDWPIQRKLVLSSALTSSIALALACTAFVVHARLTFPTSLARELEAQADIIGRNSSAALLFSDPASATDTLNALSARDNIIVGAIYTAVGQRFASYSARGSSTVLPEVWKPDTPEQQFEANRVTVHKRIVFLGDNLGGVVLSADLREMNARVLEYTTIALAVLAVSLLAVFAVAFRLQQEISRPILDLADVARSVSGRQDYSVRAQVRSGDEIGFLVRTFNQMLGHIEERERALEKARDAALEASRLKTAFLANMSHEIRTPLNVILGYNEVIELYLEEHGLVDGLPPFEGIKRAGRRLIETIDSILDISRIESGAFELHPVPLRIADVVERSVEDARVLAEKKGLMLVAEDEAPEATVIFDEHCLSQLLSNLLSNAIKFTPAGRVTVRLARQRDGTLELSVADTGIGIAEEYLPHLFEPFSQENTGTTRPFEGSGLGLALVRSYAQLNGARVSVSSHKGVGTTFRVQFPRSREIHATVEHPPAPPAPPPPAPTADTSSTRPTVLVVEDDAATQTYMQVLLEGAYDVVIAGSAAEARGMLAFHGRKISVILLDIALGPDEDGLSLTRSLRQEEHWSSLPIIATTAHALPEDRLRAKAAGCTAYVAKPFTREALFALLEAALAPAVEPLPPRSKTA